MFIYCSGADRASVSFCHRHAELSLWRTYVFRTTAGTSSVSIVIYERYNNWFNPYMKGFKI